MPRKTMAKNKKEQVNLSMKNSNGAEIHIYNSDIPRTAPFQ